MVYIGHEIPKLLQRDWHEVSAMHIGRGVWFFSLKPRPTPESTRTTKRVARRSSKK